MSNSPVINPPVVDISDTEIMPIESTTERWSEAHLEDGSMIRVKPVIIEVRKSKTQKDPATGEFLYIVKSAIITDKPAKG